MEDQKYLFPDMMIDKKKELLSKLWAMEVASPVHKVLSPADILPALVQYQEKEQEHFLVVTLNGAHEVIRVHVVSIGIVNRALVHPREVFRPAFLDNAVAIIMAHNHPSGNFEPFEEDKEITKRLKDSGELLGIEVLDSLIISKRGFYSFLEDDKL